MSGVRIAVVQEEQKTCCFCKKKKKNCFIYVSLQVDGVGFGCAPADGPGALEGDHGSCPAGALRHD